MKRFLLSLFLVLGFAVPARAQLGSVPFVFTSGTVISSSEVNQNFATAYSNALNRTGGTMTGTLNARDILPVTDNTYDLGSAAFSWQDGFFDGVLTTVTAAVSNTGAAALDVAGGITAGTGNVAIIDTTGKIPAISSTYFASLSGTNLTGVALLASANAFTSTGTQTFAGSATVGDGLASRTLIVNGNSTNASVVWSVASSGVMQIAAAGGDSFFDYAGTLNFRSGIAGTVRTALDPTGILTHGGAFGLTGVITASTLSAGENHNYAPGSIGSSTMVRVAGNAITPSKITGITGGFQGRRLAFCNTGTDLWSFKPEDADSTSSNRIAGELSVEYLVNPETCSELIYDGTSSRWRVVAGAQPMSPL